MPVEEGFTLFMNGARILSGNAMLCLKAAYASAVSTSLVVTSLLYARQCRGAARSPFRKARRDAGSLQFIAA